MLITEVTMNMHGSLRMVMVCNWHLKLNYSRIVAQYWTANVIMMDAEYIIITGNHKKRICSQ